MNIRNTVKEKQTADSLGFHKCQSHTETLSTAAEDMELFLEKKKTPEVEDLPPLEHRSGFREKLGHERPLGFDWEEKFFLLLYNFVQLLNTIIFLGQHIYLFY